MYIEVVVSDVREIVVGIAACGSQIIVMVVDCWVTGGKKFKKIIKKPVATTPMAPSVAIPTPIWTDILTTIP